MSSIKGKTFMNSNGDIVRVGSTDGNSVILDNGDRVSLNKMLDTNNFQEINESSSRPVTSTETDPFTLMNNNGFYSTLVNQTRNINTSGIGDSGPSQAGPTLNVLESVVERHGNTNNNSILVDNADDNIERLKRQMIENQKNINSKIQNSNSKLGDWLDAESTYDPNVTYDKDRVDRDPVVKMYDEQNKQVEEIRENPVNQMFKSLKRSVPIDIDVTISEMLPKKEFIQMWEESYDVSIIDFLAQEFVNKYARNPVLLKNIIVERIREYAYGKPEVKDVIEKKPRKAPVKKEIKKTSK